MELIDKLKAALDEDERLALANTGPNDPNPDASLSWTYDEDGIYDAKGWEVFQGMGYGMARLDEAIGHHVAQHDPARVLRQVAAHRKILDVHGLKEVEEPGTRTDFKFSYGCVNCHTDTDYGLWGLGECDTLLALAEAYGIEP